MDPITAAIVAALSSVIAEVGKEGVLDAYKKLKSLLSRKFGSRSKVLQAIKDLENNPTSQARTAVLQEEVANVKADQDPELRQVANELFQQIHISSVRQPRQFVYGDHNTSQIAGREAYSVRGNVTKAGRDVNINRIWPVVLMAIVLVAIFAFVIWQYSGQFVRLITSPTPTPTPLTATPEGTLMAFCTFFLDAKPDSAYQLYSDNLKKQVTTSQFAQEWAGSAQGVGSSCVASLKSSSGTTAIGTITANKYLGLPDYRTYNVTLIKKEDGQWAIDSMQKISTPTSTPTT